MDTVLNFGDHFASGFECSASALPARYRLAVPRATLQIIDILPGVPVRQPVWRIHPPHGQSPPWIDQRPTILAHGSASIRQGLLLLRRHSQCHRPSMTTRFLSLPCCSMPAPILLHTTDQRGFTLPPPRLRPTPVLVGMVPLSAPTRCGALGRPGTRMKMTTTTEPTCVVCSF
jgi:hypothetical protein